MSQFLFQEVEQLFFYGASVSGDVPGPSAGAGSKTFSAVGSDTWTAPANVGAVQVECVGGGAGGFGCASGGFAGSSAGGGGAYAKAVVLPVPGVTYTVVVGAGGVGETVGVEGPTAGASSTFGGDLVVAVGGEEGADKSTGGIGGLAASCVGSTKSAGGDGAVNVTTAGGGGGGAGGAVGTGNDGVDGGAGGAGVTPGGAGGAGGADTKSGTDGVAPGGAGSGSGAAGLSPNRLGGDGADGTVIISWPPA